MHVGGSGCIVGVGGRVDLGLMVVGGIEMEVPGPQLAAPDQQDLRVLLLHLDLGEPRCKKNGPPLAIFSGLSSRGCLLPHSVVSWAQVPARLQVHPKGKPKTSGSHRLMWYWTCTKSTNTLNRLEHGLLLGVRVPACTSECFCPCVCACAREHAWMCCLCAGVWISAANDANPKRDDSPSTHQRHHNAIHRIQVNATFPHQKII